MRSDQPVPSMPYASHLVQIVFDGIGQRQKFERHYEDEGQQLLLWAFLHPLPGGSPPVKLGDVAKRLNDLAGLRQEIAAITPETGAAYHRLGLRVQWSMAAYKAFDIVVGMAAQAVADYIALPAVRTVTVSIQLNEEQQEALGSTLNWYQQGEQAFLADCLQSGIAHAQDRMRSSIEETIAAAGNDNRVHLGKLSSALDDDIPF